MTDTPEQYQAALKASHRELVNAASEYFKATREFLAREEVLLRTLIDARRLQEPPHD